VNGPTDWETPPELFEPLSMQFPFDLDVCASAGNRKCDNYFGLDHAKETRRDGLTASWDGLTCWCNPPYNDPMPWVRKAAFEAYQAHVGATTVMLLPVDTSTKWFTEVFLYADEIWFLTPRVKFVYAQGSPRWANMVVVFRPHPVGMAKASPSVKLWKWKYADKTEQLLDVPLGEAG
jgi:phage N-6-adenine-methyltransferase